MEIRIKFKHYVLSICIGKDTPWFQQSRYFGITREYFDDSMNVIYADRVF